MRLVSAVFIVAAITLFCLSEESHGLTLTAEDIAFLKGCNIEQADIDAIHDLPEDGQTNIEMVLDYPRKHSNMDVIVSFKATREFLKKFIPPPPEGSPAPAIPDKYNPIYLTPSEHKYISELYQKLWPASR